MTKLFAIAAAALMLTANLGASYASPPLAQVQQPGCQNFPETGKTVCGAFLTYWKEHGALAQQGYPISNELKEVSEIDGKSYTVQYFERAVFESHPENKAPFNVLLSLLGTMRLKDKYPNGAPELPPDMRPGAGMVFPETGKEIRNAEFMAYWKEHGGLAQNGYPITNLVSEKSDLDGKTYTVQYFERAEFELHPELKPPFNVLLSQLGTFRYKSKYPANTTTVPFGMWGGDHIQLAAAANGSAIEFDCAHATIDQTLMANSKGEIDLLGKFIYEHGGPVRLDEKPDTHPARFTGITDGKSMTLTITLTDSNKTIGTYVLVFGQPAKIMKCL